MQVWTNEPIEEGEAWVKYDELYFTAKVDDDWSCNRSVDQQSFPFESKQWPKLWEGAYSPQQRWPSTAPLPSLSLLFGARTDTHTCTCALTTATTMNISSFFSLSLQPIILPTRRLTSRPWSSTPNAGASVSWLSSM